MPAKQKILFVITKSNWGGAQHYVHDLACALPRDRFEVVVAAGGNGIMIERLASAGIRTIPIRYFMRDVSPLNEIFTFAELLRIYKKVKPDIIHLNSSKAGAIGALAAWWYKYLPPAPRHHIKPMVAFTVHGWGFLEDRSRRSLAVIFFISWLSSLFQDRIILISKSDHKLAKRFIPARKLAYIPLGIGPIEFYDRVTARKLLEQYSGLRIGIDTFLAGSIAELTYNKNLSCFIEALREIAPAPDAPDVKAVLIGEGELRDSLDCAIRNGGLQARVALAGFIADASRLLPAFDAIALPSLKEGLPYVIMEAMRAGVPVIASYVGGIPDMINHERNGFIVAPGDSARIAAYLRRIANDNELGRRMALRAKEKAEREYTLEHMVNHTIHLYASP